MNRTDSAHNLEAARMAALDASTCATTAKSTIVSMQTAADGSVDWMVKDALDSLRQAKLRLEAAERCLQSFKKEQS